MKRIFDHIRDSCYAKKGIFEPCEHLSLTALMQSEWCPEFEQLMRNRMIMGALRYGKLKFKGSKNYNYSEYLERKFANYKLTGNTEMLVDIANICMLMFLFDKHPNKHFNSLDDQQHCK